MPGDALPAGSKRRLLLRRSGLTFGALPSLATDDVGDLTGCDDIDGMTDQEQVERTDRAWAGLAETACAMKTSSSTETDGRKK